MAFKNKADAIAYAKKYRETHREALREQNKLYYLENKEHCLEKGRFYDRVNKDVRAAQHKANYDKNKTTLTTYNKWNTEKVLLLLQKSHPDSILLSDFKKVSERLDLQCEHGHVFKMRLYDVIEGHWCQRCAGVSKPTIEGITDFIFTKYNGTLLSNEYVNSKTILTVSCKFGHQFTTRWQYLQSGYWCPDCAGTKKLTLDKIQSKLMTLHPGTEIVSTEYKSNKDKISLICNKGHHFKITWNDITHGYWCSECSGAKSERYCRDIFEKILNTQFNKTRIYYDNNNRKKYYEIDGFCKDLKLGFEYQGRQHYEYVAKFHKDNKLAHLKQQQFDKEKLQYLAKLGYYIIEIPYTIKQTKLIPFIEEEIKTWLHTTRKA